MGPNPLRSVKEEEIFFKLHFFILAALGLRGCVRSFSCCGAQPHHGSDFSCCGARALGQASVVAPRHARS